MDLFEVYTFAEFRPNSEPVVLVRCRDCHEEITSAGVVVSLQSIVEAVEEDEHECEAGG